MPDRLSDQDAVAAKLSNPDDSQLQDPTIALHLPAPSSAMSTFACERVVKRWMLTCAERPASSTAVCSLLIAAWDVETAVFSSSWPHRIVTRVPFAVAASSSGRTVGTDCSETKVEWMITSSRAFL